MYPRDVKYKSKTKHKSLKNISLVAAACPMLFIALTNYFVTKSSVTLDIIIPLGIIVGLVCGLLAAYIYTIDLSIRKALFIPEDISKLIAELSDDATPAVLLDVMLRSVLSDTLLVKAVTIPNRLPGIDGPEREEIKLSETLFKSFAQTLLHRKDSDSEIPFEEDVFRVAVLESLGGRHDDRADVTTVERHDQLINEWAGLPLELGSGEHPSIPLVRGLCTFVGGFGEVLTICSAHPDDPVWGPAKPNTTSSWTLPPAVASLRCPSFRAPP